MKEILGLQYLRAVAALGVVLFHCGGKVGLDLGIGQAGVDLFFIISGFLMVVITGPRSRPETFLANRVLRIVPAYWLATSVFLAGAVLGAFPSVRLTLWHVVSSYLFIPSLSPSNGHVYPLLIPGWTLNYEMFFYALFALALLVAIADLARVLLLSTLLTALVLYGLLAAPQGALLATYTHPIVLEFVLGAWIGLAWKRGHALPGLAGMPSLLLALLLLAGALALGWDGAGRARLLVYGLPMALVLLSVLAWERRGRIGRWPGLLLLGDASYSIYLWHTMAISAGAKAAQQLGLSGPPLLALLVAASLGTGLAGYAVFERPVFQRVRRRKAAAYRLAS